MVDEPTLGEVYRAFLHFRDKTFPGRGGERVAGGPGTDQCFVDPGDRTSGCEQVFVGPSQQSTSRLSAAVQGQGDLAEELIEQAGESTFPPCENPGEGSPAPCPASSDP